MKLSETAYRIERTVNALLQPAELLNKILHTAI